jgi:hypothetical protein
MSCRNVSEMLSFAGSPCLPMFAAGEVTGLDLRLSLLEADLDAALEDAGLVGCRRDLAKGR